LGKKATEKSAKNVFLYSHEYRAEKMGEKKRAKQFFQKQSNNASKKCWGKISSGKSAKNFFYIHTNIVIKKWGDKMSETIFPETHESASKTIWEKNRRK